MTLETTPIVDGRSNSAEKAMRKVPSTEAAAGDHRLNDVKSVLHLSSAAALSATIAEIRTLHRQRMFAQDQRKRADLALGALLRLHLGWQRDLPKADGERIRKRAADLMRLGEQDLKDKPVPDDPDYIELREVILMALTAKLPFATLEKNLSARLEALARGLPVWAWAEGVRGFGAGSLAVIVGEAGDLSAYPSKSHLWKRCGLAVLDGVRQGGLSAGAPAAAWIAHGYSPRRRSRIWTIGDCLIKSNGDGPYRRLYLERKEIEKARAAEGEEEIRPIVAHRRAQRYMEKKFLSHLRAAWIAAGTDQSGKNSP